MASGFALVAALLLAGGAVAQDGGIAKGRAGYKHPLTDVPPPAEGISAVAVFPEHLSGEIPLGGKVPVLLGFRNGRERPVNVTFAAGSVNAPGFFAQFVQNLTVLPLNMEVPPGAEVTLPYGFQASPQLAPVAYTVALTVFYTVDGAAHASTAFNGTVRLTEPPSSLFDSQSATMLALGVGAAVAAAAALAPGGGKGKAKGGKAKAAAPKPVLEQGTAAKAAADNEWLVGTSLWKGKAKKAPPPKKAADKAPAAKKAGAKKA